MLSLHAYLPRFFSCHAFPCISDSLIKDGVPQLVVPAGKVVMGSSSHQEVILSIHHVLSKLWSCSVYLLNSDSGVGMKARINIFSMPQFLYL